MCIVYENISINDIAKIDELEQSFDKRLISKLSLANDFKKSNNSNIYGIKAIIDNSVIGYGYVSIMVDHADLIAIGVNKEYRGKKIATNILLKIEEYLKTKKEIENIFLEVNVENIPAIKLYETLGYVNISTRKKYYENKYDAYILKKELTN